MFVILAAIVLGGIAAFLAWDRHQDCKVQIEGTLRRHHATDIKIKLDWLEFDRDTFTYDVEYRDRDGKVHNNRCKVTAHPSLADDAVYWVNPIDPPFASGGH
jgi:hypothetical protein